VVRADAALQILPRYRIDDETARSRTGLNLNIWATVQAFQRFVIEPSLRYTSLQCDDNACLYGGYIGRARTSVQITRAWSTRVVKQYNHFSGTFVLEPLMAHQI